MPKYPPCIHRGETKGNQCRCKLASQSTLLSPLACTMCQSSGNPPSQVSRGLGDTVAKFAESVGLAKCGGCGQRQEFLNKMVPYKKPS